MSTALSDVVANALALGVPASNGCNALCSGLPGEDAQGNTLPAQDCNIAPPFIIQQQQFSPGGATDWYQCSKGWGGNPALSTSCITVTDSKVNTQDPGLATQAVGGPQTPEVLGPISKYPSAGTTATNVLYQWNDEHGGWFGVSPERIKDTTDPSGNTTAGYVLPVNPFFVNNTLVDLDQDTYHWCNNNTPDTPPCGKYGKPEFGYDPTSASYMGDSACYPLTVDDIAPLDDDFFDSDGDVVRKNLETELKYNTLNPDGRGGYSGITSGCVTGPGVRPPNPTAWQMDNQYLLEGLGHSGNAGRHFTACGYGSGWPQGIFGCSRPQSLYPSTALQVSCNTTGGMDPSSCPFWNSHTEGSNLSTQLMIPQTLEIKNDTVGNPLLWGNSSFSQQASGTDRQNPIELTPGWDSTNNRSYAPEQAVAQVGMDWNGVVLAPADDHPQKNYWKTRVDQLDDDQQNIVIPSGFQINNVKDYWNNSARVTPQYGSTGGWAPDQKAPVLYGVTSEGAGGGPSTGGKGFCYYPLNAIKTETDANFVLSAMNEIDGRAPTFSPEAGNAMMLKYCFTDAPSGSSEEEYNKAIDSGLEGSCGLRKSGTPGQSTAYEDASPSKDVDGFPLYECPRLIVSPQCKSWAKQGEVTTTGNSPLYKTSLDTDTLDAAKIGWCSSHPQSSVCDCISKTIKGGAFLPTGQLEGDNNFRPARQLYDTFETALSSNGLGGVPDVCWYGPCAHPELNDTLVPYSVQNEPAQPGKNCPTNFCVQATAFVNNRVGGDINFEGGSQSISCSSDVAECAQHREPVPAACEPLKDKSASSGSPPSTGGG